MQRSRLYSLRLFLHGMTFRPFLTVLISLLAAECATQAAHCQDLDPDMRAAFSEPAVVSKPAASLQRIVRDEQAVMRPASREAVEFVRGVVLLLLPHRFEDENGWGDEKRIQSGLHMKMDGLEVRTKRKWNMVNHGSWTRASGFLIDPENTLKLDLRNSPTTADGISRYEILVTARIFGTAQQQQWNHGVRLWSISADAEADLRFDCRFEVRQSVTSDNGATKLRFEPKVTSAEVHLDRFRLKRISHMKGSAIREAGSWFEGLIRSRIRRENGRIAEKINEKLAENSDRFELPFWFGKMQPSGNSRD